MREIAFSQFFTAVAWAFTGAGILSFIVIVIDIIRHPQPMKVMNFVWPLNALWGSLFILWAYFSFGRARMSSPPNAGIGGAQAGTMGDMPGMKMSDMKMGDMKMPDGNADGMKGMKDMDGAASMDMADMDMHGAASMDMSGMDMSSGGKPFWQKVAMGTLHCGSGCTLADIAGTLIFFFLPFTLFGNLTAGEWVLDYILALLIGVTFQYAALAPMVSKNEKQKKGGSLWLRALQIDFFSLTSWQIGMYGWMAVIIFGLYGRIPPTHVAFWFFMQIAMCAGFIFAFPVNWVLIKKGIKKAM